MRASNDLICTVTGVNILGATGRSARALRLTAAGAVLGTLALSGCASRSTGISTAAFCERSEGAVQQIGSLVYSPEIYGSDGFHPTYAAANATQLSGPVDTLAVLAGLTTAQPVSQDAGEVLAYAQEARDGGETALVATVGDMHGAMQSLITDCGWHSKEWPDYKGPWGLGEYPN